ncbi:MAG TPA: gephyrin-like molybdotransferase Glp [Terriglobales bacterium]|jgi:molybdopterin molybdotransferase|nr:gephyrin-like molybdotransferase Glp [Terriglobales bacterium]
MAAQPEPSLILSFEDARHLVEEHAARLRPRGKELVELLDSAGQVLAEPVAADRNLPSFPRATRDGYAVRAADLAQLPARLEVIGDIKAGVAPSEVPVKLEAGQAAGIMTGAPAPPGADAVVMVEYTSRAGNTVEIAKGIAAGDNIVPAGAEARRGARLLAPGMRLDYAAVAVAASVGRSHLLVYAKPQVAVLATGDEVVDIDALPGPNQIRNSNTYSLAAQVVAAGGEPVPLPIAPDEPGRLRELITDGLEADLLLLAGGVSMGKYDLVEQVLAELQAEFFFTGVQIQPGRPLVFGRVPSDRDRDASGTAGGGPGATYFFGLPGNPVSTMVCFELFARPVLEALAGMAPRKLRFLRAQLKAELNTKTGLKRFLPAILSGEFEQAEVELAPWQGSGDIAATARANCYLVVAPDRERIAAGEWVPVLLR